MRVDQDVMEVLDRGEPQGQYFALREGERLERELYLRVNKVLEAAGGKWNRRAGKHVFEINAAEALEPVFLTGQIVSAKSEFGFFETPPELAELVCVRARIREGHEVLEPSAGRGAIARVALEITPLVDAVELLDKNFDALLQLDPRLRKVERADFMLLAPRPLYDRVVMNPPFAKRADVRHILRAAQWLRPEGRLVAIASQAVEFRDDALGREFRDFVRMKGGEIQRLPEGSFKASGTDVNTALVSFNL